MLLLFRTLLKADGCLTEITEVYLPDIQKSHLKKAVEVMYTGKLKMSKSPVLNDHLLKNIKNILVNMFKINIDLVISDRTEEVNEIQSITQAQEPQKTKSSNMKLTKEWWTHNNLPWSKIGKENVKPIMKIKEEPTLYECSECGKKYNRSKSLDTHIGREHNSKALFECPEKCGKMLTSRNAIKKHILSHLPQDMWPYQCPKCPKRFQAKADIPKHLNSQIHKNDSKFVKIDFSFLSSVRSISK